MSKARSHHLAQANLARIVAPLDDPAMAGFVEQLQFIKSVADRSPGFVWRFQTEDGDATSVRVYPDDRIIFNMSVWQSVDALYDYIYKSEHRAPLRNRRLWFERMEVPHLVLWWIPVGHLPDIAEAKERLELLHQLGPNPRAFNFQNLFSADGEPLERSRRADWTFA